MIIDDCPDSQFLLQILLQSITKTQVISCNSAKSAISELSGGATVGLILSDLYMQDGGGEEIFDHLQKSDMDIPFILMTAERNINSDIFNDQFEQKYPDNSIVKKPLTKDTLSQIIESKFPQLINKKGKAPKYYPVRATMIFSSNVVTTNIYLKLSSEKYVKVFEKGHEVTIGDIKKYEQKNIEQFFIEAKDVESFSNLYLERVLQESSNEKEFNEVFNVDTYTVIKDNLLSLGIGQQVLLATEKLVQKSIAKIFDNPTLVSTLKKFSSNAGYMYSHSMQLAYLCPILLKELNFGSENDTHAIIMASMFHDMSLIKDSSAMNLDLKSISWKDLDLKTINAIRHHPNKSAKLIEDTSDNSDLTRTIIEEHEEIYDGSGYPEGLKEEELHPLSKIFIFVHAFVRNFTLNQGQEDEMTITLSETRKENNSELWQDLSDALEKQLSAND